VKREFVAATPVFTEEPGDSRVASLAKDGLQLRRTQADGGRCAIVRLQDATGTPEETAMAEKAKPRTTHLETVEPLGERVLIRKDEDKKRTKGGIELPDSVEIPTITGRIVAVSAQVAADEAFPIRQYDKVLFNPKRAIPVDFEADNQLFVVPIEDVVAVFRKAK